MRPSPNENVPPLFRDDREVLKYKNLRLPRVAHGRMACVTKFIQSNRVRKENLVMFRHQSWAYEKLTKFVTERSLILVIMSNARFTLADPMPRLGSDVVGGNSGRNHPTSRRHTIHIGRMARNVSIRVGWYEGVVQYCTTPWLVR